MQQANHSHCVVLYSSSPADIVTFKTQLNKYNQGGIYSKIPSFSLFPVYTFLFWLFPIHFHGVLRMKTVPFHTHTHEHTHTPASGEFVMSTMGICYLNDYWMVKVNGALILPDLPEKSVTTSYDLPKRCGVCWKVHQSSSSVLIYVYRDHKDY